MHGEVRRKGPQLLPTENRHAIGPGEKQGPFVCCRSIDGLNDVAVGVDLIVDRGQLDGKLDGADGMLVVLHDFDLVETILAEGFLVAFLQELAGK